MIKKLLSGLVVVSSMLGFTSCLNEKADEVTYYDDTAVTAFTLGTLNRYLHTTASDGVTDSIYKSSYSAGSYVFYIDQQQRLIYNPDSLPYATDARKILATITSKNGGTVLLNLRDRVGRDSLAYYSTTDSIDFSKPVRVRIYNMRATAYREYTVTVNIHQQRGDEMVWSSTEAAELAEMGSRRYVNNGGQMYLFGVKGGQTVGFRQTGGTLTLLGGTLDAEAYKNVVALGGKLYALSGGNIMESANGEQWTQVASGARLTQLVGASDARLYGLGAEGVVSSADHGATWTADALDDSQAHLPTADINFVCQAASANAETNVLFLVGTRDGKAVVWRKVEENGKGAQVQPWAFYPADEYNKYTLPALSALQVMGYGKELVALGGDFSTFYFSADQGLTWIGNKEYRLAKDFDATAGAFALGHDDENMIYISKAGTTTLWRGRMARMGWAENR